MSHFYSEVQGHRGRATRGGTAKSGIYGHIRGWDLGIEVEGKTNPRTGEDYFIVTKTSGSNGSGKREHIITVGEHVEE